MAENKDGWADETSGAIQKLCCMSYQDDKKLMEARGVLKRLANTKTGGESLYDDVKEAVLRRLRDHKSRDEWYSKYRLLEAIPTFIRRGDPEIVAQAASLLDHENAMVRHASVDCVSHLVNRSSDPPKIAEEPCSRSNSRPSSAKLKRQSIPHHRKPPLTGKVIGEGQAAYLPRVKGANTAVLVQDEKNESKRVLHKSFKASMATFNRSMQQMQGGDKRGQDAATRSTADSGAASRSSTRGESYEDDARMAQKQKGRGKQRRANVFQGIFEHNWVACETSIISILIEKLHVDDEGVRVAALTLLGRAIGPAKLIEAVREALPCTQDDSWRVREAAVLALRELAISGDLEVEDAVVALLSDSRREVREGAAKAFETVINKGDADAAARVLEIVGAASEWRAETKRPEWELLETCIAALGGMADSDDAATVAALQDFLKHEKDVIKRAATHALGRIAERAAPLDMVWTYNNATAQPSRSSAYCDRTWDCRRQAFVPVKRPPEMDKKPKHAPEELLQMVQRTPRGGRMPHLLTTPRQEHLYERRDIVKALRVRESRTKEIETLQLIQDLYEDLQLAVSLGDDVEVARLEMEILTAAGVSGTADSPKASSPRLGSTRSRQGSRLGSPLGSREGSPTHSSHGAREAFGSNLLSSRRKSALTKISSQDMSGFSSDDNPNQGNGAQMQDLRSAMLGLESSLGDDTQGSPLGVERGSFGGQLPPPLSRFDLI